ncbi:hypothetical protein ZHAS_00018975 [Anopheles sinensis]|uniref:Uncharacterized protein n=1 Tax=Anopheles sinensis TaxID=74873 RepID=A0A084WL42_ANOSI|nr:hypothetical protein ZHAS_00018975 [Anopheles sinensis]
MTHFGSSVRFLGSPECRASASANEIIEPKSASNSDTEAGEMPSRPRLGQHSRGLGSSLVEGSVWRKPVAAQIVPSVVKNSRSVKETRNRDMYAQYLFHLPFHATCCGEYVAIEVD